MTTVLDHEHVVLARMVRGAAAFAHPDIECETCRLLAARRTLDHFAAEIEAAVERVANVNNTPHEHTPATTPKEQPPPPPDDPPPPPPDNGGQT